jgi:predicted SnoaL-like aldol condensation-catalyzing enzyme
LIGWRENIPGSDFTWGASMSAKGNYVVLDCFWERLDDMDWARIDIFRLNSQVKIVEQGDVLQTICKKSTNDNTTFYVGLEATFT